MAKNTKPQEILYAAVGIGDLAVEKVKSARRLAERDTTRKIYTQAIGRGRTLSRKARNTPAGKRVVAGTEVARKQVQDATKTVTKAFGVNIVSWPGSRSRSSAPKSSSTTKTTARKKTTRKPAAKAS